ncbi:hypothetical protein ALI22I_21950 [Saccharothrix sp. ALI-22-I]|uniref:hypothetical protein n=1 Tax=Saccharothrix sp. ALI-22-I TaxID=1933778 RepID=UPI00097CBEF8|nr:hypothetical protein [Saccharothrix sp. ALI-22-I]ONI87129.1 hypothetical protein ALI22I_21950 [Saccharothrix sp. ALI-22-I]
MKDRLQLTVPGAVVGAVGGLVAGVLAAFVGQPYGWAAATALAMAVPLGLLGGGFGLLVGTGRFRLGVFAPAALYWLVGFPSARLVAETSTGFLLGGGFTPPADMPGFLAYQGIVSFGWSIGFLWLHERIAPHWLDKVRSGNVLAQHWYERYVTHARVVREASARARRRRAATTK